MYAVKVFFVLSAILVAIRADDDTEQLEIHKECAKANGVKLEAYKKGEKLTGPPPMEVLCTMKCVMDKQGILTEGKIDIEKAKQDPKLKKYVSEEKIESMMECLKDVEVKECADMVKVMACSPAFPH